MSKARLVIAALFVEHKSSAGVAARYGVHRAWVPKLKARYEAEADVALTPASSAPEVLTVSAAATDGGVCAAVP